jgi:hypothetical protein
MEVHDAAPTLKSHKQWDELEALDDGDENNANKHSDDDERNVDSDIEYTEGSASESE